jgi:UDP-N-acetylglucosamine 2-epimerase
LQKTALDDKKYKHLEWAVDSRLILIIVHSRKNRSESLEIKYFLNFLSICHLILTDSKGIQD